MTTNPFDTNVLPKAIGKALGGEIIAFSRDSTKGHLVTANGVNPITKRIETIVVRAHA